MPSILSCDHHHGPWLDLLQYAHMSYWEPSIPSAKGRAHTCESCSAHGAQEAGGCFASGHGTGPWPARSRAGLLLSGMPGLGDVGLLTLTGPRWRWEKELGLCFTAPDVIPLQSAVQGRWLKGRICSTGPLSGHGDCGSRGERGSCGVAAHASPAQVGKPVGAVVAIARQRWW